jgi:ABC-type transporter Mla maintaining outer membrane lipid asymmetry ATPase subunit MlaF
LVLMANAIVVRDVVKAYGGLRPLRAARIDVAAGDVVAIEGYDQAAAAVFTDLLTGTTLPDTGDISIEGQSTRDVDSQDAWLAFLDRFGLVNDRVVLLDQLTMAQNLAVPLTLDLEPLPNDIRALVERLATEVGLDAGTLDAPLAGASAATVFRVRLGRALAHAPRVVIIEHPTLGLHPSDVDAIGRDLQRVASRRSLTLVVCTGDHGLQRAMRSRVWVVNPANGAVSERRSWRLWSR